MVDITFLFKIKSSASIYVNFRTAIVEAKLFELMVNHFVDDRE